VLLEGEMVFGGQTASMVARLQCGGTGIVFKSSGHSSLHRRRDLATTVRPLTPRICITRHFQIWVW